MNERRRDMFLWQWSRKRQPGRAAVAIRGAVIGALGGLVFAVIMFSGMGNGNRSTATVLSSLRQGWMLLGLSIPAFAAMGFTLAYRIFSSQEAMYQSLLRAGARVPDQKPVMAAGDHGPAIAVAIAFAVIAAFIIFLIIKFG